MSTFRFPLARVLRVRVLGEELARESFARAQHAVREAESRCAGMRLEIEHALTSLLELFSRAQLATRDVLVQQGVIDLTRRALARQEKRLAELRAAAERARDEFQRARRERESLERLERRASVRHREDEERLASRALDEVALQRSTRSRSTET